MHPTPNELELVIDFVNTRDIEKSTDALAGDGLREWLESRGLLDAPGETLGERERAQATRLREALRAVMLANNGAPPDAHAGPELEGAASRGGLSVHFTADGSASLAPAAPGFAGALARLLVPVAYSSSDGTWSRAKACRAPDCQWAFYDRSRNHSGVWCDMAVCGNRTKVRAYRGRKSGG